MILRCDSFSASPWLVGLPWNSINVGDSYKCIITHTGNQWRYLRKRHTSVLTDYFNVFLLEKINNRHLICFFFLSFVYLIESFGIPVFLKIFLKLIYLQVVDRTGKPAKPREFYLGPGFLLFQNLIFFSTLSSFYAFCDILELSDKFHFKKYLIRVAKV